MPGQPPPDGPDDRTVLYALPEDQPDGLLYRYTPPEGVWGSGDGRLLGAVPSWMLLASKKWPPV